MLPKLVYLIYLCEEAVSADIHAVAAILRGALEAAALNVLVNTKTMTDRSAADHLNARCFALLDQGRTDGERIFCAVRDQLV